MVLRRKVVRDIVTYFVTFYEILRNIQRFATYFVTLFETSRITSNHLVRPSSKYYRNTFWQHFATHFLLPSTAKHFESSKKKVVPKICDVMSPNFFSYTSKYHEILPKSTLEVHVFQWFEMFRNLFQCTSKYYEVLANSILVVLWKYIFLNDHNYFEVFRSSW